MVKSPNGAPGGILKDLGTFKKFRTLVGYTRAIYLFYSRVPEAPFRRAPRSYSKSSASRTVVPREGGFSRHPYCDASDLIAILPNENVLRSMRSYPIQRVRCILRSESPIFQIRFGLDQERMVRLPKNKETTLDTRFRFAED